MFLNTYCQYLLFTVCVIFSQTLVRYVRLMASAIRLSFVCDVDAPYIQRVELLGNIFAPSNSLGTRTVCAKIVEKIQGFYVTVKVKWKGYEELVFVKQYLTLSQK